MSKVTMLTTTDNPFDPFTQFDDWYAFDTQNGYDSCGLLARVACTSNELSPSTFDACVEQAIDFICLFNPNGKFKKVTKDLDEPDYIPLSGE